MSFMADAHEVLEATDKSKFHNFTNIFYSQSPTITHFCISLSVSYRIRLGRDHIIVIYKAPINEAQWRPKSNTIMSINM